MQQTESGDFENECVSVEQVLRLDHDVPVVSAGRMHDISA
jgi:hypothetical protein